jgi:tetratricopeptide (TPR) repeat protein
LLGLLAFNSGETERGLAEVDLAKKLGRTPKNAPEARTVAGYFGDAGRYEQAAEFYRMAIAYDSTDYESELKLGVVLSFMGANAEAATYLRQFLSHVPDFFKANPNAANFRPVFESLGISTQ